MKTTPDAATRLSLSNWTAEQIEAEYIERGGMQYVRALPDPASRSRTLLLAPLLDGLERDELVRFVGDLSHSLGNTVVPLLGNVAAKMHEMDAANSNAMRAWAGALAPEIIASRDKLHIVGVATGVRAATQFIRCMDNTVRIDGVSIVEPTNKDKKELLTDMYDGRVRGVIDAKTEIILASGHKGKDVVSEDLVLTAQTLRGMYFNACVATLDSRPHDVAHNLATLGLMLSENSQPSSATAPKAG